MVDEARRPVGVVSYVDLLAGEGLGTDRANLRTLGATTRWMRRCTLPRATHAEADSRRFMPNPDGTAAPDLPLHEAADRMLTHEIH